MESLGRTRWSRTIPTTPSSCWTRSNRTNGSEHRPSTLLSCSNSSNSGCERAKPSPGHRVQGNPAKFLGPWERSSDVGWLLLKPKKGLLACAFRERGAVQAHSSLRGTRCGSISKGNSCTTKRLHRQYSNHSYSSRCILVYVSPSDSRLGSPARWTVMFYVVDEAFAKANHHSNHALITFTPCDSRVSHGWH